MQKKTRKKRRSKTTYWAADTESTVPPEKDGYGDDDIIHEAKIPKGAHVWATSLTPIDDVRERFPKYDEPKVIVDESMEGFFNSLDRLPEGKLIIFFHNLKWDAEWVMKFLKENHFHYRKQDTMPKDDPNMFKVNNGEIITLVSGTGHFYNLKFRWHQHNVEIRDSLKILPFSLDMIGKSFATPHQKLKGSVDYGKKRPVGYHMDSVERAYVENDVLVLAEALKMMDKHAPEWRKSLTIGSMCMKDFLSGYAGVTMKTKRNTFRKIFPELDPKLDSFFRYTGAYSGGWCAVNPKFQDRNVGAGFVYDVNSLYPSVMAGHRYPYGEPEVYDGRIADLMDDKHQECFFVNFDAEFHLKPRRFPFLQEHHVIYRDTPHLSENPYGVPMNLTLSRPDFELFLYCYDVDFLSVNTIWRFKGIDCPFDNYIYKHYNDKKQATIDHNKVLRQIAKLFLNNLYGKFAQSPIGHSRQYFVEDGAIKSYEYEDKRTGGYLPVGAYITAYARSKTVHAACDNYDTFMYSDTDSIHLCAPAVEGTMPSGEEDDPKMNPDDPVLKDRIFKVDPVELGAWDNESRFEKAKFVRQKTYIEKDANTHEWTIRAAGCPSACKERMLYLVTYAKPNGTRVHSQFIKDRWGNILQPRRTDEQFMRYFDYGMIEAGKKRTVRLPGGGITLMPTTFKLTKPNFKLFEEKDEKSSHKGRVHGSGR